MIEINKLAKEVKQKKNPKSDKGEQQPLLNLPFENDIESVDFTDLLPYVIKISKIPTKPTFKIVAFNGETNYVTYDPIGTKVFSGNSTGNVKIWDPDTGKEKLNAKVCNKPITGSMVKPCSIILQPLC